MSTVKLFGKSITINFSAKEWLLLSYYAWKYKIPSVSAATRKIIAGYANADKRLDPNELLKFARTRSEADEPNDELRVAMLREAQEYAQQRKPQSPAKGKKSK